MADAIDVDEKKADQKLTDAQKARIERSRQKALLLKQSRLKSRPYPTDAKQKEKIVKQIDTGGGFFVEEDESENKSSQVKITHPLGAVLAVDNLFCNTCEKEFLESYLHTNYDALVCDNCRQDKEEHPLITKSDAKAKYLLKDEDLDRREPPLKFVIKKNPRNSRWGDMKLYYEPQVYKRAMEIWESETKLEEAHENRSNNREKAKQKKFDKKIKELRKKVRSSLVKVDTGSHQHEFGEETYDEDEDMYSKKCQTCGHVDTYEKM